MLVSKNGFRTMSSKLYVLYSLYHMLSNDVLFFSLYYKYDLSRLSTCTLTVHALLHIASSIRATGPVWAYWAFPTERYCGRLLPCIKSRRHPYQSINHYVTASAHLTQIKLLYNLENELVFQEPPSNSHQFLHDDCKSDSKLSCT